MVCSLQADLTQGPPRELLVSHQEEAIEGAHTARAELQGQTVVSSRQLHILEAALRVADLCVSLVYQVVVWVVQDQLLQAKRSPGKLLLGQVQFAQLLPPFLVTHEPATQAAPSVATNRTHKGHSVFAQSFRLSLLL